MTYRDIWLVRPLHRAELDAGADPDAYPSQPKWAFATRWALVSFGRVLQLELNDRMGSFAGQYKVTAYLQLAHYSRLVLRFVPRVVGRHDTRGGIKSMDVVEGALAGWAVVQAFKWAKVEQVEDEGDE